MSCNVLFNLGDFPHAHLVLGLLQRSHGRSYHCHCYHGCFWDLRPPDLGPSNYGFAAVSGTLWKQLGEGPLDTSPLRVILFRPSSRLRVQRGFRSKEAKPPSGTSCQGNNTHGCVYWLQLRVVVFALLHNTV